MPELNQASHLDLFTLARFRLTIEAITPLHLPPYKGSALRGLFGQVFRRVVCPLRNQDCQDCVLQQKCVYAYIFETIPPPNDPFLQKIGKMDKAPHPFIIRPPLEERRDYEPGEQLTFELILIGRARDYLPYFAYTFMEMGKTGLGTGRGKFLLSRIDCLGQDGARECLYLAADQQLRNNIITLTGAELLPTSSPPSRCTFRFLTRLRLRIKRKYLTELHFGVLFRHLLQRLAVLAYLHCGLDCSALDFQGLRSAAYEVQRVSTNLYWEDLRRFSNRQQRHTPLGGLRGEITFAGNLAPFWPFLCLGEQVHVGKGTSFGLGQYQLIHS
ncbi:MAG: CRISPR system precrRNA processing endoribonuclease RAMP protein Cas6 [Deltaproteobacteria bacterium]|nr:CRISPR system precrRNA processing endoribonuclease RAMP protein Cas6 [Deltaproteobacteria bacterium]